MSDRHVTPVTFPQGLERPPPGTRAMGIVRWALVVAVALAAVAAWRHELLATGAAVEAVRYTCPMHPSVVADHEGDCPLCGMKLVAAAPRVGAPAASPEVGEPAVPGVGAVELDPDQLRLAGVRTAPVSRQRLGDRLRTPGVVMASEAGLVSVQARTSGWVESVLASTGQLVEKGEVLATVYAPDAITAQQVLLNSQRWSDRRAAAPAEPPAGNQLNDVQRDARQRLELLGLAPVDVEAIARSGQPVRAVSVRSPIRGHVARRGVLRGSGVQAGTELFQLVDLSTVAVVAEVRQQDLSRVRVGQPASLELSAWPGERFAGTVDRLYPALSGPGRALQARVTFKNPSLRLRPGMSGELALELDPDEAVVVARGAVVDSGELQYVFVDQGGGRFAPRRVRTGWAAGDQVEVLEGLAEGEQVATAATFLLESEGRIRTARSGGDR
jgi:membrane fusion protein, copper/silver efflux system